MHSEAHCIHDVFVFKNNLWLCSVFRNLLVLPSFHRPCIRLFCSLKSHKPQILSFSLNKKEKAIKIGVEQYLPPYVVVNHWYHNWCSRLFSNTLIPLTQSLLDQVSHMTLEIRFYPQDREPLIFLTSVILQLLQELSLCMETSDSSEPRVPDIHLPGPLAFSNLVSPWPSWWIILPKNIS